MYPCMSAPAKAPKPHSSMILAVPKMVTQLLKILLVGEAERHGWIAPKIQEIELDKVHHINE